MTRRLLLQRLATALVLAGFGRRAVALDFPDWYTLANAAAQNKTEDVAGMLQRGANPNVTDGAGRTPLGYAAAFGNSAMLKLLLEAGARVDYRDSFGRMALHWAAEAGQAETIRLLLAAKAPVDATARQGITPLMLAAGANTRKRGPRGERRMHSCKSAQRYALMMERLPLGPRLRGDDG